MLSPKSSWRGSPRCDGSDEASAMRRPGCLLRACWLLRHKVSSNHKQRAPSNRIMSLALSYIRDALPTTRQFFPSRWQLVQGWSRVETSQRTLRDLQERQACIDRGRLERRAIGLSGAITTTVIAILMTMEDGGALTPTLRRRARARDMSNRAIPLRCRRMLVSG